MSDALPGILAAANDGGGEEPTLWLPSDDANIANWWDATDPATLTLSGAEVTAWLDKIAAAVLTPVPTFSGPDSGVRSYNGKNVLDFVMANSERLFVDLEGIPQTGMYIILAAADGVTASTSAIFSMNAGNDWQFDYNSTVHGEMKTTGMSTSENLSGGNAYDGGLHVIVVKHIPTVSVQVYVDGTLYYEKTASIGTIGPDQTLYIMTNRSDGQYVDGAVMHVVLTGSVDDATRWKHEGFLAHDGGIQANLPGGHAYLSSPPLAA